MPSEGPGKNDNEQEGRGSAPSNEYQACPQCGLPHPMSDTACGFCGTKLPNKITLAEKWRRIRETAKWRYKVRPERKRAGSLVKEIGSKSVTILVGATLALVGAWFLYSAVLTSSFSDFIFGALFLLYGAVSIYNTFKNKPD